LIVYVLTRQINADSLTNLTTLTLSISINPDQSLHSSFGQNTSNIVLKEEIENSYDYEELELLKNHGQFYDKNMFISLGSNWVYWSKK